VFEFAVPAMCMEQLVQETAWDFVDTPDVRVVSNVASNVLKVLGFRTSRFRFWILRFREIGICRAGRMHRAPKMEMARESVDTAYI
jgi:hypothetical protein